MRKAIALTLLLTAAIVASGFIVAPDSGYAQSTDIVRNGEVVSGDLPEWPVGTTGDVSVAPSSDVFINFDDTVRPCLFVQTTALRDEYAALGVEFSGPDPLDGGAVLNQCGNFGVNGHSSPNFLGFNCGAMMLDSGVARGPEVLTFSKPVRRVFASVGSLADSGSVLHVIAISSSGVALDSDFVVLMPQMQMFEVASDAGISQVLVGAEGRCIWVLDDLGFDYLAVFTAPIDILPRLCPNVISEGVREFDYVRLRPMSAGARPRLPMVRVAILGGPHFDVHHLDSETVRMEGLTPLRWAYGDVAGPVFASESECECTDRGPDGFTDMIVYFDHDKLLEELEPWKDGDTRTLALNARMHMGRLVLGADCVELHAFRGLRYLAGAEAGGATTLSGNTPNPFNAGTIITYSLAEDGSAQLAVFDVLGRKVAMLIDQFESAGPHEVEWNGRDDRGQSVASGMYFYRLTTGTLSETRKMVLLK